MWKFDKETRETLQTGVNIVATILIPILITIFGLQVNSSISEQGLKKDYVQLAVEVLAKPDAEVSTELKNWAIEVLAKNSPVPFTPKQKQEILKESPFVNWAKSVWTSSYIQPPADLMLPAWKLEGNDSQAAKDNSQKLEALQNWIHKYNESVVADAPVNKPLP